MREASGGVREALQEFHVSITLAAYHELAQMKRKQSKYRNKPRVVDGIRFASKKEAKRYQELQLEERAGEIRCLMTQVPFALRVGAEQIKFDSGRQATYVADFVYERKRVVAAETPLQCTFWDRRIEDTKGKRTDVYKLKRAIMRSMGHEIVEV